MLRNEIDANMIFIPSAIFTNYPKVEADAYAPELLDFVDESVVLDYEADTDKAIWQETFGSALFFTIWKQAHRHARAERDVDFLNYFNPDI